MMEENMVLEYTDKSRYTNNCDGHTSSETTWDENSGRILSAPHVIGAFLPTCNEPHPMLEAAVRDNARKIRALAEIGVNVNTPNTLVGFTPVAAAAGLDNVNALKALLELGADYETKDSSSNTPVCIASGEGNCQSIEILAEFGADVNASGSRGWTPVIIAAQKGNTAAVDKLVDLGADINMLGKHGESALDLASTSMDINTSLFLVDLGADVSSYMEMVAPSADIHNMFDYFCQKCNAVPGPKMYTLFSLVKLMLNIQSHIDLESYEAWESSIACAFQRDMCRSSINLICDISYDVRRRFVQIAESVSSNSLHVNGTQMVTMGQRYVELVCFFFDEQMLLDVFALRTACRGCPGYFPIPSATPCGAIKESLVESFVAYPASQHVSTDFIQGVIGIYELLRK